MQQSQYELKRIENMKRNEEYLAALGIERPSKVLLRSENRKRFRDDSRLVPQQPQRRSARFMDGFQHAESEFVSEAAEEAETAAADEAVYENENLYKYIVETSSSSEDVEVPSLPTKIGLKGLSFAGEILSSVYSAQYCTNSNFLLAGGKDGCVGLFRRGDSAKSGSSVNHACVEFKAHSRWVSSVQFIDENAPWHILTAADDGAVKIWNLEKQKQLKDGKMPLCIGTATSLHGGGIYSMDYLSGSQRILTGSKDKTVCISRLNAGGLSAAAAEGKGKEGCITVERQFGFHSKVVKSVCWQKLPGNHEGNVFASGGQDRCVLVKDVRSSSLQPDISLRDAHDAVVHCVRWGPCRFGAQELLMTCGLDSSIQIFDLRMPRAEKPLVTFQNRVSSTKGSSIMTTPLFYNADRIVAPMPEAGAVAIYSLQSKERVSHGNLETRSAPIAIIASDDRRMLCLVGRNGEFAELAAL